MGGSSEGLALLVLLVLGQHLVAAGDSCNNPGYWQHLTVASVWSLSPQWLLLHVYLLCSLQGQRLSTLRQIETAVVVEDAVVAEFAELAVEDGDAVVAVDAGVVVAVGAEDGTAVVAEPAEIAEAVAEWL